AHRRHPAGRATSLDVAHGQRAGLAALPLAAAVAPAGLALLPREDALGLVLLAVVLRRRRVFLLHRGRDRLLALVDRQLLAADLFARLVVALLRRRRLALHGLLEVRARVARFLEDAAVLVRKVRRLGRRLV